jgi:regulatory protein
MPLTEVHQAREKALALIAKKDRTVAEVKRHLDRQNVDSGTIELVIADLQRMKLVDDKTFARRWIEMRLDYPAGREKFAEDLANKGVEEPTITEILDEFGEQLESDGAAANLLRKQAHRYVNLEERKARQRMYGLLARRGFDGETAVEAVDLVLKEIQQK